MGGEEVVTPNLDRLARQGTAFANAYVMGSMIGPVCVAARSMTLTGRGLFDLEREGRVIPPEHTTLPEAFRSAGYETFVSGKWHNDRESLLRIFDKGGTITGNARPSHWRFRAFDFAERKDHERIGVHSSEMIADEVIDFLNRRDRERPFFAYKNFQRAVRVGDWKLHRYSVRGEETTLLFHLSEDPWERFDLSAEPLLADKVAELTRVMQEALREAGDDVDLSKAGWGVPEIPSHPGPETPKDGYPGYWGRGIEHEPGRDIPMGRH